MSKMKKFVAVLLTAVMVMAMGMTSFAAEVGNAKITVENLEAGTTIKAVQVIKPNTATETGWEFASDAMKTAFRGSGAFASTLSDQQIIWMLIKYADANAVVPNGTVAATAVQVAKAIGNIPVASYSETDVNGNVVTIRDAGVYAVYATAKAGSQTVYDPMAAYVNFTYNDKQIPTGLENQTIYAKKSEVPVEKTVEDDDKVGAIGDTVTYKVVTAVPHTATWTLTDTITGASYVIENGQVPVMVKIGTADAVKRYATLINNGAGFELDLKEFLTANNYGADVLITYQAVVEATEVENEISDGKHDSTENFYTGQITLTKYAEDGTTTLAGAGFEVYDQTSANNVPTKGELLTFDDLGEGVYKYNPEGTVTEVFTNENGVLIVKGLDKGNYFFKETTAPEGYSINEKGAYAEINVNGEATTIVETTTSIIDTKLSSLPSTGGIGTTIFTIGGCVIMIVAAALFFASRKRSER